jgi:hypothetical protein
VYICNVHFLIQLNVYNCWKYSVLQTACVCVKGLLETQIILIH